jgi:hypothetical protein
MTDTATAEAPAEETPREPCLCGCGQTPARKRSRFMPGHDAQLKARLYAEIRNPETSEDDRIAAAARLDEFEWAQPAPKPAKKVKVAEAEGDAEG